MTITELLGPIKTIEITGTDKDKEISTLTAARQSHCHHTNHQI